MKIGPFYIMRVDKIKKDNIELYKKELKRVDELSYEVKTNLASIVYTTECLLKMINQNDILEHTSEAIDELTTNIKKLSTTVIHNNSVLWNLRTSIKNLVSNPFATPAASVALDTNVIALYTEYKKLTDLVGFTAVPVQHFLSALIDFNTNDFNAEDGEQIKTFINEKIKVIKYLSKIQILTRSIQFYPDSFMTIIEHDKIIFEACSTNRFIFERFYKYKNRPFGKPKYTIEIYEPGVSKEVSDLLLKNDESISMNKGSCIKINRRKDK